MKLDYREVERDLDAKRSQIAEIANKPADQLDTESRDLINRLDGECQVMEQLARELRDKVIDEARTIATNGDGVGEVSEDYMDDFRHLVKTGEARASLSTTDANGGFIVPEPIQAALVEKLCQISPVRQYATNFSLTGGDTNLYIPVQNALAAVGGVTAEAGARAETNSPTFSNVTLTCYDQFAMPYATQTFLDAVDGAESWLLDEITRVMAQKEGTLFTTGTGSGEPQGFVAGISTHTASGASAAAAASTVLSMLYTLPSVYARTAKLWMNRATLGVLSALAHPATTNGTPFVTIDANGTHRIQGIEIVECPDMADIGAGNFPIWYGDMAQAYAVGTHKNLSVLRDPFTAKPKVAFYALMRTGGVVKDAQAAVKYEIAAS